MASSMTAYGRAAGRSENGGREILAEIKSVNSRYLDCTVKLPRVYGFLETKTRKYLTECGISRGKVDVYVSVNVLEEQTVRIELDRAYTASYLTALRALRDEFGLADDITVMSVASHADIFTKRHEDEDAEQAWQELRPVLDAAVRQFLAMREREGDALVADLLQKKETFEKMVEEVEARAAVFTENYRKRLEARLRTVLEEYGAAPDENRLLTECAIYADQTAVDEEIVRLKSHCRAFGEIAAERVPIGRKLDFLLQEMNRETNTIGSKCDDTAATALVVEMKCLLEKIREQVQNLE